MLRVSSNGKFLAAMLILSLFAGDAVARSHRWRRGRCAPCRPTPAVNSCGTCDERPAECPTVAAEFHGEAKSESAAKPPAAPPLTTVPVGTESPPSAAAPSPATESPWQSLFDGESLDGWKPTNFGGEGDVLVEEGTLVLAMGSSLTGVTRTGSVPEGDYEIELEAQRLDGRDFFCGLTFPAKGSHCSLIVGGWGGGLVGISSIDGNDASENSTTNFRKFQSHRWYKIRVQVTSKTLAAWIDDEKLFERNIEKNQLSVRGEVEASRPLGLATYETRAAYRNIRWRKL